MEIAVGSRPGVPQHGDEAYVAEVVAPGVVLLAVAHGFGRIRERAAPAAAATAIREAVRRRVRSDRRDPRAALASAFSSANARVYAHSGSGDDYVACGASLTAALIVGEHAYVGHVGATRGYLGRNGALQPLTVDDAVAAGPLRLLTRAVGTHPTVDPAISNLRLLPGDALVLSSGAIHELLDEDEIADALRVSSSSEAATARLLAIAGIRGDGAGTVIVGRALTEALDDDADAPHRSIRDSAIAAIALILAIIIALAMIHGPFAPG